MRSLAILGLGALLFGWVELVLSPRPLMGQSEGRGGVATGVIVGTAASSVAMTGSCAAGYIFVGVRAQVGEDVGGEGYPPPILACGDPPPYTANGPSRKPMPRSPMVAGTRQIVVEKQRFQAREIAEPGGTGPDRRAAPTPPGTRRVHA